MSPAVPVPETELEVLKVLWSLGSGTVHQVRDALAEAGGKRAYTTVQTLLVRLEQKGVVSSRKQGRAFVFEPKVTRDEFLGDHLHDLAEKVCEGEAVPLVLSLFQGRRFDADQIARFRELLDELQPSGDDSDEEPTS